MQHPGVTKWAFDPLRLGVEMPRTTMFFPLGYPVELSSNCDDVFLAAEENWAGFPRLFSGPPIQVRIVVEEVGAGACASGFEARGQGHLISMVSDARNFAVCDPANHFAFCFVTAATASNRAWFRYFFLDSIVNLSLWRTHLTRIHAGCVALGGCGILFCGASGAGKSCLTYACARRGWTLVSDEAPSLIRRRKERIVIGKPQVIHLREGAFNLFPELRGRELKTDLAGKFSFELRTAELPGIRTAYTCPVGAVVFLDRKPGARAALTPLDKTDAWRRLEADLPYFGEPAHEEHKATLQNVLGGPVYELKYSTLDNAIEKLERIAGD